jgi:glycosyltransferase involved in cell wall biosynthesis
VVDGGSTDNSVDVVKSFASSVRLISQPGSGQAVAINAGMKAASGDLVTYLNSDDLFEDTNAVEKAVRVLLERPDTVAVYGDVHEIDRSSRTISRVAWPWDEFDPQASLARVFNPVVQPGCIIRRKALAQVGYFNESRTFAMDWDLWFRLASIGRIVRMPFALGQMRVHGAAKTVKQLRLRLNDMIDLYDDAFRSSWISPWCAEHENEIRVVLWSYCLMLSLTMRERAGTKSALALAVRHARHSNFVQLSKLLVESLQHRRGVTVSRYFTLAE